MMLLKSIETLILAALHYGCMLFYYTLLMMTFLECA